MERIMLLPTTESLLDKIFQSAIKSCSTPVIKHVLSRGNEHGYVPSKIVDFRALRLCKDTLVELVKLLPGGIIINPEVVVIAMESDNVEYLRLADKEYNVRDKITNRDVLVTARKGALGSLKWYHQVCDCSRNNYVKCMLDDNVYKVGLQSHHGEMIKWLETETNCGLKRMGYSQLGYVSFGYGDLRTGGRGFIHFER